MQRHPRRQPSRTSLKPPDGAVLAYRQALRARVEAFRRRATAEILVSWDVRQDAAYRVHTIARELDVIVAQELGPSRTRAAVDAAGKTVARKGAAELRGVVPIGLHTEAGIPAAVDAFRTTNVNLIRTLGRKEVDRLIPILEGAERTGLRVEELRSTLEKEFGVTKSKADLLARDQTLKLSGQLNQMRQQNSGIDQYRWSTSNDERVRPYHVDLEGTIQSWSAPPIVSEDGRTEHPGGDYQCRCVAIPVLPDYENMPDLTESETAPDLAEPSPLEALSSLPKTGGDFFGRGVVEVQTPFTESAPGTWESVKSALSEEARAKVNRAVVYGEKVSTKSVDLGSLTSGQPSIRLEDVRRFIEHPEQIKLEDKRELPVVAKLPDGRQLILDGHHRLSARKLLGQKSARVTFVDILKLAGR